ncbi:hypothetical protein Y1Q_0021591 [Alligator mississippiensis]|uniref:Uncharacterized protein n=1 Tax=Alligator mississippiensis TaxID=8496 RepID=A0A151PA71_ALLMI|nr:hypothetical protein Y1Q_0021591 [Alligator mississippiensis]
MTVRNIASICNMVLQEQLLAVASFPPCGAPAYPLLVMSHLPFISTGEWSLPIGYCVLKKANKMRISWVKLAGSNRFTQAKNACCLIDCLRI